MNGGKIPGVWLCMLLLLASTAALAELSVAPIFGDSMVLQRGAPVPVFGTADAGATVRVSFGEQELSGVADNNGSWQVTLDAMDENSTPSAMEVTSGGKSVSFADVQVGEVWLCSGQSNMGFPLSNANDSASAIADAGSHNIRLFRMTAGNGPGTTSWQVSDATTVGNFSAVCYWMGLELSQWLDSFPGSGNVPIGLIQATHDGTAIDHWQHSSSGIGDDYDAMVKAIQPFALQGVLWYQGESNGGDAGYAAKLTNMINEWRSDWEQAALPFGIVQLAYRSGWNVARNAQLEVADSLENAFLVVIRDLPGGALHPPEKKPVGIRSAIGARGAVYGENITFSGPIRDIGNSYVNGSTVVLHWQHLGDELVTDDGLAPGEFKLAGANGRFKTADAAIVGDTVEVWSASVPDPVRVQYSYRSIGNLYSSVSVSTAGGTDSVEHLKASEFEFSLEGNGGNQPPVARFGYSVEGRTANFDGSTSSDSDGGVNSYDWDFGENNSTATGVTSNHTYATDGTYTVVLTVTDNQGATDQTSQSITVGEGGGTPTSLHVQSLIAYAQGVQRGSKQGAAEVVVIDDLDNPVANASVTVNFSGTISEAVTDTTDATGFVKLTTTGQAKGGVSVSACVDSISKESLEYIPNGTACID